MEFRKDINGLRATAVIAVVLFHFNASWLPGGFVGVDIFFVISGFLMTGIIFRGFEQQNFSILKFYIARANRIIPALAALCLALLIFSWFYLSPLDYPTLAKHSISSISFLSNLVYWQESGYFHPDSLVKWLLHTWSLSVEWQFYLIYPLMLVAVRKILPLKILKLSILVVAILGYIFCIIASNKWPVGAYYLLPSRVWEMLVGGIAYLYPFRCSPIKKRFSEWSGLLLIVSSFLLISQENIWPGYLAIFPVIGTFFIIQAQQQDSFITGNIIFQILGKWSYSIYLWHWPIVVAIYYFSLDKAYIYYGIALSVILGAISYRYIERIPFKKDFNSLISCLKCKPLHIATFIALLSLATLVSNGFMSRYSPMDQKKYLRAQAAIDDWYYPKPNLQIDNYEIRFIKGTTDKNILFIGASHIEQTYSYVEAYDNDYNIYYLTMGGCFISPSYKYPGTRCDNIQNYTSIIESIKFDKIVTSIYTLDGLLSDDEEIKEQQLTTRISEYNDFLRFAKNNTDQVYMILGEPKGNEFDPKESIAKNLNTYIFKEKARYSYKIHYHALTIMDQMDEIIVIDPIDYLCDEVCKVMDENYNYYYMDGSHMRPWYARQALGYLNQILEPTKN